MDVDSATAARTTADRIDQETASFKQRNSSDKEMLAVQILNRCYRYRRSALDAKQTETFGVVPKYPGWNQKPPEAPWFLGDLATGETGAEFIYAYLPVRFVERLLDFAEQSRGSHELTSETITAGATVYFLNNLRDVLDEAMENLFFEASTIITELARVIEEGKLSRERERFAGVINGILSEGDARRKSRLKRAMWELNPHFALDSLTKRYGELLAVWQRAAHLYRHNKRLVTWKKLIHTEISSSVGIELPLDLVSLLSPDPDDRPVTPPETTETSPSGLALEHAARLCGIEDFKYSSGHLRNVISAQKRKDKV
jgi:hypothetical protein